MSNAIDDRIHWALTHGIGMGQPFVHAPVTMDPFPYPTTAFCQAKALAPLFNVLIEKIGRNPSWLIEKLRPTSTVDDFVRRLIEIYEFVLKEGIKQSLSLAINRSDYMLHAKEGDPRCLLQVEINTIASSFGSLSTRIAEMHEEFSALERPNDSVNVPKNHALEEIANGIAAAHNAYLQQTGRQKNDDVGVGMIVQPGERNFADQRLLQFQLWQQHRIRCFRITLSEMNERGRLCDNHMTTSGLSNRPIACMENELMIDGYCLSVVYFRAGYSPEDHPTEKEWDARLLIERSLAIKCPTIAYHLAGCKKIQQVLAEPGVLEQFITSSSHCQALRTVFAGLYSLDAAPSTPQALALVALKQQVIAVDGKNYVMKPQREGGGNNFYDKDVTIALQTMTDEEQSAYILMERILPPSQESSLLRNGVLTKVSTACKWVNHIQILLLILAFLLTFSSFCLCVFLSLCCTSIDNLFV